ncbi:uncharacterized protein EpC_30570 [Erwinia pyrifoliae Ep1/96]|uniref:Uncharacterized protein n=1 Tax=Erwinia pyrifoliae TaxID=79967 RepID=D0UJ25_ERWPY|nr:unknown [Erwinia pyrifoliae]CAX56836.1 uncharacterized protein EpC_30570 [Erwinia pyrifoliae Ep1/96]
MLFYTKRLRTTTKNTSLFKPRSVFATSAPNTTSMTKKGMAQLSYNAARHRNTTISDIVYKADACSPGHTFLTGPYLMAAGLPVTALTSWLHPSFYPVQFAPALDTRHVMQPNQRHAPPDMPILKMDLNVSVFAGILVKNKHIFSVCKGNTARLALTKEGKTCSEKISMISLS